ncbi:MAG: putative inorganic carbon transporter subunit DabA [Isosphaerales bacterium]
MIEHAAHLLPAQGPITVFIHHNTLHGFEDLRFDLGVEKGAHAFGCQPYLTEDRYREALTRGRIRFGDLQEVLEKDLGDRACEKVPCFGTLLQLRLALLQYPLRRADGGVDLARRGVERPAARPAGGIVRGPGAVDRGDASLGDARPAHRVRSGAERLAQHTAAGRSFGQSLRAARPVP